jgi:hypothetical protein
MNIRGCENYWRHSLHITTDLFKWIDFCLQQSRRHFNIRCNYVIITLMCSCNLICTINSVMFITHIRLQLFIFGLCDIWGTLYCFSPLFECYMLLSVGFTHLILVKKYIYICVCVCVCVCARACVRVCVGFFFFLILNFVTCSAHKQSVCNDIIKSCFPYPL